MTVQEVLQLMRYAINKEQSGYLSPSDFNTVINTAQFGYYEFLMGQYQEYRAKRPIPVVGIGQNERIRTSLSPFVYQSIIPVDNITGIAPFPYGFIQVDAMWGQYGFYNIRFAQQEQMQSFYNSVIDPIQTNPIYLIRHEGFQFFPSDIGNAKISYYVNPPYITYAYTEDNNGLEVYDITNSSQPVWSDLDMMNIIIRALAIVGVNLQFPILQQYSEEIKRGGQ